MPPSPGNQDFAPTVISSTRRNRKSAESSGRSDNILPTSGRRNRSRGRSFDERPVTSSTCNRDVEPRSSRQAQRPRPPSQPQPSSQSQKRRNEGRQNESHLANSAFSTASSQSHHSSQGSGTRPRGSSSRPRRTANGSANNTTTGRTRPRSRPARSLSRDFRRSLSRARAPSLSRHNLISSTTRDIDISTEEGRQLKKRSVERRHKPNILERRRMDKERKVQQRLESERVNEIKGKIYYYGNGLERRDSFESKSCAGASVWSLTSAAAKSTATATTTTMRRQSSSSLTKATAATDGAGRRRRLIRRMSDSCRDLKSGLGGRRFGGGNDGEESEEDIDFFGNLGVGGNGDGKKEGGVRRPLNASRRDSMDCMRSFRRLPSVTANPLSKINDGRIDNIDNHKDKSDDNVDNNNSKHDNGGGSATAEQRQLNRKRSTSLNAGKNKHNLEEINHEARCKYSKNNSRTPSKETGRRPAEEKQQRKSAQRSGSFTLRRLSTGSCPSLGDKNKHEKRNNANDNRKTSPPPKISQRSHGKRLAKSNSVSPTRRSDDKYPPPSQHPRGDRHNQLVRRNSFDASFRVKPGDGVNKWQQPHSRSQGHHKSHNQSHARKTPSKSAAAAREHRNHSSSSHKHATSASSSKHPSSPNRRVAAASSLANKHNHTSHKNTREISPEILASMAPYENPSTNERTETKAGEGTSESDAENTSKTSKDSKERKKMMNVSRKGSAGSLSVCVKSRHRKTGSMDSAANNNNKSKTVNDSTKRHHRRNGSMDSAIKTVDKNKKKVPREGNDDHDDDESNDDEESKGNKDRKSKSTDGDKKKIKEKSTKDKKAGKNSCLTKRRCILGILLILMLAGAAVGVLMFLKPFESEGDGGEQTNLAKDSNFDALSDSRSAPTTAPTLASTAKNTEPTPVVEDVTIAIIVQLDNKPEETGFYLATVDNSTIYVSYPIGSLADRPYDDIMDMVTVPSNIPLVFTILDSAGDGIDDGYYRVFSGVGVDKKVIISGDSFISSSMNHTFVAGVDQDPLESTSSDPNESCKPCPDGGTSCGRCAWCHVDQGFLPDAIHSYQCHTPLVSVPEKCFIGDKRVVHHNQYVSAAAGCKNGFQPWPQLKSASGPKVCVEEVKCVKSFEDGMPDCQMEEEGSELVQESCQDKIGGVAFGYDWGINAPREKECEAQEDFVESIAGRCCVDGISFCSTFLDSVSRPTDSKEWKQNSTLSAYSGPTPTFQPTTSNPPTWDGYPISVVLQLDDWPQETGWKITSLDESIVYGQRKPGFYKETDLVVENVQIPEGTEVLLTITDSQGDGMCCENGNGYYQVYDEKGSLILDKSGDFADSTSSIFVVADLKSLAPTSSSSPTTSPRPSYDQFTLTIVMQFDQWSSETGFSISSTDSGTVYYDWPAGTFYEPFGRSVEQIQLPLGMDVTFTVTDTGGDGMCCLYGDGSFKIFAGEDIEDDSAILVSNSGDFEKETSVSFTVGYPEESSKNSTSTEAGGTTPIGGKAKATVVMQLDKYSAETGWFILSSDGATTVISRPIGYYEANSEEKIEETIELDAGVEYKFKVTDLFGDGFCCWAGSGWYALYQGTDIENESKQLFYGDGEYGLEREHNFILESSTTVSPTNPSAALAAPSSHPTTLNAATTTAPTELTVLLDVMITFDDAAEETGWSVVSTLTGQVYLNHPPGHYDSKYSGNTITETFGVPPGEYVLHLVDSFGDGFCCDKGVGGIRISSRQESSTESSKELLSVQGSFQLTQSEVFVVDAIIPPSSIIDSSNGTVPSPPYSADNSTQYDLEELIGNSTLLTANDDNATSAASDVILIDNATLTHQQSYNTTESAESMNSTNLTTIPMPSESNTTDLEAKFADTPQGSLSNDTNRPDKVAKNLRGAVRKSRENLVLDHLTDILGEEIFREHLSVIAARWIIDLDPLRIDPDDPNLIQRFILVLFYLATDGQREGRGWTFNGIGGDGDNWLIDTPHLNECDWSGITCTETETNGVKWNAVFSIQTNGYGLDGFLPKALSKLNYLHVLDVSIMNYGLSGPLYSDILNMATLQRLAIGETSLEVDIDCNDVSFDISIGPCGIENNVNKSMKCRGACCVDYLSGNSCF